MMDSLVLSSFIKWGYLFVIVVGVYAVGPADEPIAAVPLFLAHPLVI
ncbi:hypothetical protein JMY81_09470 [Brenneria goodwinii]|nr:hypothetical protein [Brenneria goodwinii]MCG8157692.1 hypothetical protein [Brenneria goodwinii]MCG8161067.1 hypothetical protein [Brenneria goodwinii]MCG8165515.1 hypothetical protein [Brenneria goodwinii]MCG8169998.1 hypothetical protein [Brenneria goodwinii]MCG8176803.1 hypothetical protein [Brenneria goodwinii]